jgi:4-diphosphocytidyl-2-C-methyl-D-erythritol kinase
MIARRPQKPSRKEPVAADCAALQVERAPAKVNLTLRVLDRRADGYHNIESLVVFGAVADTLTFAPGPTLSLVVRGPNAAASGDVADNLVLKAVGALADQAVGLKVGRFVLTKQLPVAAGLGGGSSDAAAALRLLARVNRLARCDRRLLQAAQATGADVLVCLDPRSRLMRGIGEILSDPVTLPRLPAVLVNPGIGLPTRAVFSMLDQMRRTAPSPMKETKPSCAGAGAGLGRHPTELLACLATDRNDLEPPAIALAPVIGDLLAALRVLPGCRIARMTGSGPTCFGLFESSRAALAAARILRAQHSSWWIRSTTLGRH